jgi:hypothetical protein
MAKQQLQNAIRKLAKQYAPDDILHELSISYEEYSIGAGNEAEVEYWLKCGKACGNLSSGMEKWFGEMLEEKEDEE